MLLTSFINLICEKYGYKYMVVGDENTPEGLLQEYKNVGGICPNCRRPA